MDDSTRDPLAQHPLGGERAPSRLRTLDLFPAISEADLQAPSADRSESASLPAREDAVEDAGPPLEPAAAASEETDAVAFARRIVAGLADVLILALVGAVELTAGAFLLELRFPAAALVPAGAFLAIVGVVLLVMAPFVWGTTPGMALADLKIRASDGGSPTLSAAFLRFLGFVLTGALAGVPLLVAAFDRRGRTLSDLLSGTTLVAAERS